DDSPHQYGKFSDRLRQLLERMESAQLSWADKLRAAEDLARDIAAAGGRLYADACLAIAPVRDLGFAAVMTPSAKGACYLRNLAGVSARFGTLEECVHMAVTGGE
ncbi:MAG TPA: aconitase X, partial [Anaerolineae bacterium]|nr:aconitase X [Anaerolineae bacterium]